MVALPEFGEFDLVWALDDAVNYLLSAEDLEAALTGMGANLAPRGLLAFDLNTLLTYRTFFAEERVVESGGRRLIWRGRATPDTAPGSICEASFEVDRDPATAPDDPGRDAPAAALPARRRHDGDAPARPGVPRRLRLRGRRGSAPAARRGSNTRRRSSSPNLT